MRYSIILPAFAALALAQMPAAPSELATQVTAVSALASLAVRVAL